MVLLLLMWIEIFWQWNSILDFMFFFSFVEKNIVFDLSLCMLFSYIQKDPIRKHLVSIVFADTVSTIVHIYVIHLFCKNWFAHTELDKRTNTPVAYSRIRGGENTILLCLGSLR